MKLRARMMWARLLELVAVCGLVTASGLSVTVAPEWGAGPKISLSPTTAAPGATVKVTGSSGAAGASGVLSHRAGRPGAVAGSGMKLSQAPAGLRAAVLQTLGATGSPAGSAFEKAELTASDGAHFNAFGFSVAVSGSTAVVGAPDRNSYTGAVYVFVQSGAMWSQQAELTASDGAVGDSFGSSVVGVPGRDSAAGAGYVFVRSGTTWSQQAELTGSDRPGRSFWLLGGGRGLHRSGRHPLPQFVDRGDLRVLQRLTEHRDRHGGTAGGVVAVSPEVGQRPASINSS